MEVKFSWFSGQVRGAEAGLCGCKTPPRRAEVKGYRMRLQQTDRMRWSQTTAEGKARLPAASAAKLFLLKRLPEDQAWQKEFQLIQGFLPAKVEL